MTPPLEALSVLRAALAAWPGSLEVAWALDDLAAFVSQAKGDSVAEKEDVIGWCVVELMGHRRLTGHVRPVEIAGAAFLRIDVPGPATKDEAGPWLATQFYRPDAVYCITPTTAELAVAAAGINAVSPVTRWDLPPEPKPALPPSPYARFASEDDYDDKEVA